MWLDTLPYEDVNMFKLTLGSGMRRIYQSHQDVLTELNTYVSTVKKRDLKHKSSCSQVTYNLVQETKLKHN